MKMKLDVAQLIKQQDSERQEEVPGSREALSGVTRPQTRSSWGVRVAHTLRAEWARFEHSQTFDVWDLTDFSFRRWVLIHQTARVLACMGVAL